MREVRLRRLMAVCGVAASVIALAACGTGNSNSNSSGGGGGSSGKLKTGPGVDAKTKTISLGVLTPLSGPVALIGKPLTAGNDTYFKALNAKGGIDGWKVKLVERDTQYVPQNQVQSFNQISNQVGFIGQSLGSPTTKAILPLAKQQNMLIGAAAQDGAFTAEKVVAPIGTPYAVDVANGLHYVTSTHKNAKIGIIYQNDAYGQDGLRGYEAALKSDHFHDVGRTTYNVTDTDFTAQVQKMKSAGAQYVILTAVPQSAGKIVGTAATLNYHPKWIFQGPAWSEYLMTSTGTPNGKPTPIEQALVHDVWVLGYTAQWGDNSVPGMADFLANQKKYAPSQIPDYYYMYGYAQAQMEGALIKKALQNNDLTRQGFINARLNLGHVSFGGLIPDLTYTPSLGPADRQTNISSVSASTPGFLKVFKPYFTSPAASSLQFTSGGA